MKVVKFDEVESIKVADNITRTFIYGQDIMSVIVDFTGGPKNTPDPFHSHPHEQSCYVAEGRVLFFGAEDRFVELKAGDMVVVAPNEPHTIQLLTPTARLIDNFTPIREDFLLDK